MRMLTENPQKITKKNRQKLNRLHPNKRKFSELKGKWKIRKYSGADVFYDHNLLEVLFRIRFKRIQQTKEQCVLVKKVK